VYPKKAKTSKEAQYLYGSAWFRKARAYAEGNADSWYILSAKHELITPDTVIAPYEETLNTMPAAVRRMWAQSVMLDLRKVLEPSDTVIILAGMKYRQYLVDPLKNLGCTVKIPMSGMRIGEQLQWLNQQIGQ
jgi:hypothetical protein